MCIKNMHMYTYIQTHTYMYVMTIAVRAPPEIFQIRRLWYELLNFLTAVQMDGSSGEGGTLGIHSKSLVEFCLSNLSDSAGLYS